MKANSRPIESAQDSPHRDLVTLVRRHAEHPFRKPVLDYNRAAVSAAMRAWMESVSYTHLDVYKRQGLPGQDAGSDRGGRHSSAGALSAGMGLSLIHI